MNHTVGLLLGRKGSTRLPGKNVKSLAGVPTVQRTARNLADSGIFDDLYVSTDDSGLEKGAIKEGFRSLGIRPAELSLNDVGTNEVVRYCLQELGHESTSGEINVCVTYATSALCSPGDIVSGFEKLSMNPDSIVMSVVQTRSNDERRYYVSAGYLKLERPEISGASSQTLRTAYVDAGQFYWGSASTWFRTESGSEKYTALELPPWRAVDIDDERDWNLAEVMLNGRRSLGWP